MYFNRKNAEQKNWRMIKKGKHFLFGCSLVFAVGASLATQVVHANTAETTVANNSTTGDVNPTQNGDGKIYEAPAVAENKPEVAGTPVVSTTEPAVAAKLDGETAKEVKALDKTKLENYIAEIEAKLANGTYENKTEESVAVLKADLEAAKATLANATTQGEITKAYNKLVTTANTKLKNKPVEKKETPAVDTTNGKETVGKKAENTEKKSESNSIENTGSNDPRNGKALDKNNAFRAEIAYNIDSQGNDYGKKDSVITSGIRGSSESGNAITAVNSVMKYRARYNTDATGKITSVDWQVFFNDHLQNFANDYGVKNEVFRNYIQIPNEVNMPTDIRRLQYRAEMKFVDRKYQLVGGDGSALSDTVTFDNPTPSTAAGRTLAKNENLKINGSWDNYTRGLDTLYNNTSFYYKDAVKDELSDTKKLVNSNALPGKRVIYDNSNTGGNYRDGYVWEFTTTVPNTVTNEQLKNMKVSMGMLSTGTAGVDHGFHRIAENPVNLSKADVTPPTVKTQTVKVNEQPKAENSIANFKDLPAGTKAEFKTPVNTATPGEKTATAVVTYSDGSKVEGPVKVIVEKEAAQPAAPVAPAAPAVAPTVEIPYSNKATKEVYVYAGEKNSFDIKFKDDSGKITSAIVNGGGNQPFNPVEGEANKINAKYGFTANKITTETPATADTPAVITYSGTPAATDDLTKDKLDAATKGENPKGMVLGWRYATATDTDGASIENKAVGSSNATDPGSFLLMLKGQAQKYDIAAPTEKVTVADPANVTEAELGKIKEKLQLEYSQTNDDANLAEKKGTTVADKDAKIQSVTKDDKGNLVVTYKDGSQDKKPLSEFVRTNEKPIVEIQYSDPAPNKKEVYVYASEVNSFDIKIKDDSGKIASAELRRGSNQEFKDVAGETNKQDTQYGFTANKFTSETTATAENPAVITYTGTPAPEGDFTKEKFEKAIQDGGTPLGWRFVKAIDKDGADARGNGRDATDPTAVNVILKPQTLKYDIQTPAEADKVVVSDVNNVTDKEFEKIKEKVKVEYSQNNPDARLADKKGKEVEAASKVVDKVEKEGNNLVVTYKDGSQDKKLLSELTRTNQKPTVEIQYSDPAPDKKEVYVYASEVNSFDIKIKDDSGKLASAELRRGSNQEFKDVAGETNKQNTEYGFTANKFTTETTATAENPAVITYTGTPAPEGKFTKEKFEKAIQDGGTPLGWRFVKAIDKDGADARGNGRDVTDPTAVNVILKPQTQKYDIKTPAEADKVVVSDVNNVTDKEFEKIKEKVKLEYSQNNPDARLADKKGTEVEAASKVVDKVEKEGNNLVVTYKDGSKDKKPLADLTKTADDAAKPNAGNDVVKPADKTVVANPEKLTDAEKKAIEDKVKAVNPGATVVVDDKGNATVTTPSGNTAVIPAADVTKSAADAGKANAGNAVNTPASKVEVKDPANLTDAEKKAIEDKVKAVNPGSKVVVDDKGNATVTTPEGNTAVIPAADLTKTADDAAKPNAGNDVVKPADKTVVANPEKLTDAEKKAIEDKVKAVNPGATVVVDDKGNATVTTPSGNTAVIPAADLTKTADDAAKPNAGNDVVKPADKTVVANPEKLTDAEKKAIEDKVKAVNPGATVVVDDKGNATVTTPSGNTAVIPAADLTKTADDAAKPNAGNDVVKPADKTVVANPEKLTDAEKKAIEDKVKAVNPGATVVVDDKGNATVTTPSGNTAVIPAADLTKTADDAAKPNAGNDVVKPADKTVVANPEKLTDAEKKAIEDKVKAVNPGATVVVDDKGNATVTTPSGNTAVIPAADLTKTADDAAKPNAGNDVVKPADKTVVANPEKLTDAEKKAIEDKVKAVNPGATVVVDDKGNATVTTPEGNTAVIPAADVTKSAADAGKANAGNAVNTPASKVEVKDPANLTDAEKKAIEDKVKAVNPGATVVVDDKGNATVTTPEGNTAVIPAADVTKSAADAGKANAGNAVNTPASKVEVKDPANLTDAEKKAIEDKVKAVNPGSKVVVDDKGNATVTTPEGNTAVIPAADLTKTADDAAKPNAGNDVVKPADKTVVANPEKLTDAEKKAIEDKVKAVNPGATVVVDDKGNATVTTPSGNTAVIPAADLTKTADDAAKPNAGNDIVKPADKTVVANPDALTPEEKKAIEDKVKAVNPGATVVVDDKGNATVTTPSGNTAVIPAADLTKTADDAAKPNAGNDVVKPADKTVVANPEKLTDAEKKAIEDKVKAVNPGATVVVDDKGNATVTTPSGNTAVIPAADLTKTADDAAKPNAGNDVVKPADKTVVANPEKLTDAEKKAIEDKVKAVNPGATVVVDDKGNATVTTPSGNTAVIPAADLTKTADDAAKPNAGNDVVKPADKTVVANPEKLTDAEKKAIEDKVKAVNPGATVVVDDKGNATVTTPSGNTAVIPAADLTKTADDAAKPNAGNDVVKPADKTVVANPEKLTDAEKKAIEDKVKAVNPGATVVVDDKGNATVTTPSGNTAVIPAADLTKTADDAAKPNAGNDVVKPADKTVVANPEKLTDAEKKAIEDKVKAVNPGATVVVDDKGNATVTTPSGNTAVIPAEDLTKTADDAAKPNAGNDVVKPADKTVVANPEKLTDAEKKAIEDKVKAVNPGATVVVDDKGNATVTTPSGNTAVIPAADLTKTADDTFKQRPYVPSNGGGNNSGNGNGTTNNDAKVDKAKLEGAIHQLDELIIKESAKLDAETAKEANDLSADAKKVFANADASQAEVDAMIKRIEDFMAKVALSTDHATPTNDQAAQTPAVAPATTQAAVNAGQTASAQASVRTVAKELPNTGTVDSVVSMVVAAASALLGLGLAGRRRKEDEEA